MFKKLFFIFIGAQICFGSDPVFSESQDLVLSTKRIAFDGYRGAFNPSIAEYGDGYVMTFRYLPEASSLFLSYIGIVLLDDEFKPKGSPQLLLTRHRNSQTQSQSEDARLFYYRNRLFVIYNDNLEINNPSTYDRRDMFIAEVFLEEDYFYLSSPLKLFCREKEGQLWQKNWMPFEKNGHLYLSYSLNPHEVLYLNFTSGECFPCYSSSALIPWNYGSLRGSSAPTLEDEEFFAFFHSGIPLASQASYGYEAWHYVMGAYTYSKEPPYKLTKVSEKPIIHETFYEPSNHWKKVIFPGGHVVKGSKVYVAYGKNDCEMWIAEIDKEKLLESLTPVY